MLVLTEVPPSVLKWGSEWGSSLLLAHLAPDRDMGERGLHTWKVRVRSCNHTFHEVMGSGLRYCIIKKRALN